MTKWWVAQDSFSAESPDGAWLAVAKGAAIQEGDPQRGHLVRLDREAADAAAKEGRSRAPLFAPMEFAEEEPEPPKKAAAQRKGGT